MQNHYFDTPDQRFKLYREAIDCDEHRDGASDLEEIRSALKGENGALTNRYWEALTIFLPQCVHQNPRIAVESMVPGSARSDSIGLQYALEVLMDRQGWLQIWQQMAADALAWRGVGMVTYDPDAPYPRYMEGQTFLTWDGRELTVDRAATMTMPRMHYIAPEAYFADPHAALSEQRRYEGHCWMESVDLIRAQAADDEENDWIQEAVGELTEQGETGKVKVVQLYTPHFIDEEAVANYRGDEDPSDRTLFTGTIYTMLADGDRAYRDLRRPRLYRGPAAGLYAVGECVPMPGGGARMAPFRASLKQVDLDARVGAATMKAAISYKRFIVANNGIADTIRQALQDGVVDVDVASEFIEGIRQFETGGIPDALLKVLEISDMAVDRTQGMSDTLRQNPGSDTTATAESLANQAYTSRTSLYAAPLFTAWEQMLSTVAWHIEHSPDFAIHLPDEAVEEGVQDLKAAGMPVDGVALDPQQREMVLYVGGSALSKDGNPGVAVDGKAIRIVPMSMARTNEGLQQKRVLDGANLLMQGIQIKQANPNFDLVRYLNDMGSKLNQPGLGDYMPAEGVQPPQQAGAPPTIPTDSSDPMRQMAGAQLR